MTLKWTEQWEYRPSEKGLENFEVWVLVGKVLDVLALIRINHSEIRNYSDFLKDAAKQLYSEGSSIHHL